MKVSNELKEALAAFGITTLHAAPFELPDRTRLEAPCSIKWMRAEHSLEMGAFSYAVSGYYFATKIGRYTSIGEEVQVGRGSHPVTWASTSPLFYQPHDFVLNQKLVEAQNFVTNAPGQSAKITTIGNDCYIGHGALIGQGVTVGDGAVIGAHSVVTKDVLPYSVVVGNPAVIKKMRYPAKIIARMQLLAWWRYAFWDLSGAEVADPEAFLDHVEAALARGVTPYEPGFLDVRDFANGLAASQLAD
jgi:acetyltransferase-like isoleucine patch superfamily enzyme